MKHLMICACALYCLLSGNISFAQGDNACTLSAFLGLLTQIGAIPPPQGK